MRALDSNFSYTNLLDSPNRVLQFELLWEKYRKIIVELEKQINGKLELNAEIKRLQYNQSKSEEEIEGQRKKIELLEGQLDNSNYELVKNKQELDEVYSAYSASEINVDSLNEKYIALTQSSSETQSLLNNQLSQIKNTNQELKKQLDSLNLANQVLEEKNGKLENTIDTLKQSEFDLVKKLESSEFKLNELSYLLKVSSQSYQESQDEFAKVSHNLKETMELLDFEKQEHSQAKNLVSNLNSQISSMTEYNRTIQEEFSVIKKNLLEEMKIQNEIITTKDSQLSENRLLINELNEGVSSSKQDLTIQDEDYKRKIEALNFRIESIEHQLTLLMEEKNLLLNKNTNLELRLEENWNQMVLLSTKKESSEIDTPMDFNQIETNTLDSSIENGKFPPVESIELVRENLSETFFEDQKEDSNTILTHIIINEEPSISSSENQLTNSISQSEDSSSSHAEDDSRTKNKRKIISTSRSHSSKSQRTLDSDVDSTNTTRYNLRSASKNLDDKINENED